MNARTGPVYPRAAFYFLLLLATALLGFLGSYFMRLADNNLVRHLHAVTAFAWLLLLITQAWLMRRRAFALHRKLGRTSLALAPLFVISGLLLVQDMLARPGPFIEPFVERLAFIDLTTMAWFSAAYCLALHHRRKTPLHARYMASTALLVLPPALSRAMGGFVPGVSSFEMAFHLAYLVTELLIVALLVHDFRSEGRVRAPYCILLAIILLQQVAFVLLPGMPWWSRACAWIAAL
ncbi:MAG: hypothetical protein ABIQ62_07675 [Thermomonas sp.]